MCNTCVRHLSVVYRQHSKWAGGRGTVSYKPLSLVALYAYSVVVHVVNPVARLAGGSSVGVHGKCVARQSAAFIASRALVVVGMKLLVKVAEPYYYTVIYAESPVCTLVNGVLVAVCSFAILV